jgi:hypothetical protein
VLSPNRALSGPGTFDARRALWGLGKAVVAVSDDFPALGEEPEDWIAGFDYLSPWRRAQEAAEAFNLAAARAGWDMRVMKATAHVSGAGRAVVLMVPEAVERLAKQVAA